MEKVLALIFIVSFVLFLFFLEWGNIFSTKAEAFLMKIFGGIAIVSVVAYILVVLRS